MKKLVHSYREKHRICWREIYMKMKALVSEMW